MCAVWGVEGLGRRATSRLQRTYCGSRKVSGGLGLGFRGGLGLGGFWGGLGLSVTGVWDVGFGVYGFRSFRV